MKAGKLIILFMICIWVVSVPSVAISNNKMVSITPGGTQYISVSSSANVTYIYTSIVPDNGKIILSIGNNDTYITENGNDVQMITVTKQPESKNIIDIILGMFL